MFVLFIYVSACFVSLFSLFVYLSFLVYYCFGTQRLIKSQLFKNQTKQETNPKTNRKTHQEYSGFMHHFDINVLRIDLYSLASFRKKIHENIISSGQLHSIYRAYAQRWAALRGQVGSFWALYTAKYSSCTPDRRTVHHLCIDRRSVQKRMHTNRQTIAAGQMMTTWYDSNDFQPPMTVVRICEQVVPLSLSLYIYIYNSTIDWCRGKG